jgi:hypothetical protein
MPLDLALPFSSLLEYYYCHAKIRVQPMYPFQDSPERPVHLHLSYSDGLLENLNCLGVFALIHFISQTLLLGLDLHKHTNK